MHISANDIERGGHEKAKEREHVVHKSILQTLEGDLNSVFILTFLYVLQGIPLGLAGSVPYVLQSRKVSYNDQAVYSFSEWPFSLKLLWAPIVDSIYSKKIGRRKSWLVPTQYVIGLFMLLLSSHVTKMLGEDDQGVTQSYVSIHLLTGCFFSLNFLAATQDIAVDGWALTMLSRKNVGWASTCNTVGQTAGYFMGMILFLALESTDFCNNYLRSEPKPYGIVSLAGFLYFWGIIFLITTTLVLIFKSELDGSTETVKSQQSITDAYWLLWKIVKLPAVLSLSAVLLTVKMGFASADAVTGLKLIENGVPRFKLAMIGVPMVPIQVILPILISRYTTGPRPMDIYLKAMPYRLLMGLVFAAVVAWAPYTKTPDGVLPGYFYIVVIIFFAFQQITLYSMFVSSMALFAKVSDPTIGGTYMTLLNTISNFGTTWPNTAALSLVDNLTWENCTQVPSLNCTATGLQTCASTVEHCVTKVDGYYIEAACCFVVGMIWLRLRHRKVRQLQELPAKDWACNFDT